MEGQNSGMHVATGQLDETVLQPFGGPLGDDFEFQLPSELVSEWSMSFGHDQAFTYLGPNFGPNFS